MFNLSPEINLLPKIERRNSNPVAQMAILGLVLLFAILYFLSQYLLLASDLKIANEQEQLAVTQKEQLLSELASVQNEDTGSLQSSVSIVENISYPVTPLIAEIDMKLPENTYLRIYEFGPEGISVTADFETMSTISSFVASLKMSTYFSDIKVEQIDNYVLETEGEELINFEVIPRYTTLFTLEIDREYLRTGVVSNE